MATPPVFSAGAVLTAAQMNAIGLWEITPTSVAGTGVSLSGATVTMASATSANINGCFTSDFDNYRIIISECIANTQVSVLLRLRTSSDATTNYYYAGIYRLFAGGGGDLTGGNNASYWLGPTTNALVRSACSIDLYGPNLAQFTQYKVEGSNFDANLVGAGVHQTASAYTGFTLTSGGGNTISAQVRIYGYRN